MKREYKEMSLPMTHVLYNKISECNQKRRLEKFVGLALLLSSSLLFSCDDEPASITSAGEETAGEVVAGEVTAGEITAGATPAGEITAGESAGETPAGQNPLQEIERVAVSRELNLLGLSSTVEVVFTEGMVPNIYAENEADLGRALGYILARDRYFNMDLVRRLAQGRISELFGDAGLSIDMETLGTGMNLVTERLVAHSSERSKAYLSAVVEGINAYVEAVRAGEEEPPSELKLAAPLFGVQPTDLMTEWTLNDVISMATSILYQTNFEDKDIEASSKFLALEEIYGDDVERREAFLKDVALNMKPPVEANSASPSPTWGVGAPGSESEAGEMAAGTDGAMMEAGSTPQPDNKVELGAHDPRTEFDATPQTSLLPTQSAVIHQVGLARIERLRKRLARRHGWFGRDRALGFGSNAWAAGQQATSAGAIVSGDGHLQLSIPSIMYQVGLNTSLLGGGDIHQKGLLIAAIPVMAVGTNGSVAWSQVNPVVDITDWYIEKIQLDESGKPSASLFNDEWRPLNTRQETVNVAGRALLGSEERQITWDNYITFDGRWIVEIEGRELSEEEEPNEGEQVIYVLGVRVVPSDLNEDGEITAISFDYTAFDGTNFIDALFQFGLAKNLEEFEQQTKRLIGGGLFSAAGDSEGHILYSSYQAIPCRSYLERDSRGYFLPGQSPMALLDGSKVGGFTMLSDAEGYIDESHNDDPYRCVIPHDQMPRSYDPTAGFVATANNDPQGFSDDGRVDNDAWYLGGPWAPFRKSSIARALNAELDQGAITVNSMKRVQANVDSRLGELFTPPLLSTLSQVEAWSEGAGANGDPSKEAAVTLYLEHRARIDEAARRLREWADRGYQAKSGVETFYNIVDEIQREDAVATSIFNEYFRKFSSSVWNDEEGGAIPYDGTRLMVYALDRMLRGRGPDNPLELASWTEAEQESSFFDRLDTPDHRERSEELILISLVEALNSLSREPSTYGEGGYGSENMNDWLWGLHHMVRFESLLGPFLGSGGPFGAILSRFSVSTSKVPLAEMIPDGDPRKELKWFPRHGDQWAVDAGNPGFGGGFTFGNGAVMRMTIQLNGDRVSGYNIIPGGQSGLEDSEHAYDQLKLWLGNEAYPLRYHLDEVVEGAMARWRFSPSVSQEGE